MIEVIFGVALTALLGGLLVPVVKGWIDRRHERFESSLELVDTLATCLWTYWKLALRVAYYGKEDEWATKAYEVALKRWDSDEAWELGNNIQIKVSKSKRLLPKSQDHLERAQREVVQELNDKVKGHRQSGTRADWEQFYDELLTKRRPEIDELIALVVGELKLPSARTSAWRRLSTWLPRKRRASTS